MGKYSEVARKLTMSTIEQTRKFAEYVTGAHSWYKHLLTHPPSPFVFFLDPNAGRAMVHVSDEEVAFVDKTDECYAFHYTWQTTEAYRRRFGFWNYDAPYGRSIQYPSAEGVVDTAGSGLLILSPEGEWLAIPERLARVGTALLSALMWYPRWHADGFAILPLEQEMRIANILPLSLPFNYIRYAKDVERIEHEISALPDDMAETLHLLLTLWTGEAYSRELAETHRELNELHQKAAASDLPWGEVTRAGGGDVLHRQAEEAWEMTASRLRECMLLEPLVTALDRERQRQIEVMVGAMNQFVEMLQSTGDADGLLH